MKIVPDRRVQNIFLTPRIVRLSSLDLVSVLIADAALDRVDSFVAQQIEAKISPSHRSFESLTTLGAALFKETASSLCLLVWSVEITAASAELM